MKYIVWDLETDHSATDWCSILEIGCILLDSNFKEEQRFQARCRLPDDRVPTATALCINRTNVDLLTKSNLSHYQLINQIEKLFKFWSKDQPTTFIAYSGINFDSEVIRKEFFKLATGRQPGKFLENFLPKSRLKIWRSFTSPLS